MREAKKQNMITVVDDDLSVRKALSRLIKAAGYDVEIFESAEDFLNSSALDGSDFLIFEVQLQGMSGLELQAELSRSRHRCPFVFISAFSDENARIEAVRNGAIEFLPKPLDSDRLLNIINQAVGASPS
mgnify:FL=1